MRSNREIFWFWKSIVLDHVNEFFYKKFLDAFQELGLPDDPNNSLLDALEHFVIIPTTVKNLSELRCYMFWKRQRESTSLPHTRETLHHKVLRPHYTTVVWKKPHIPHHDLLDPQDYGWKWSSSPSWYETVTTQLPPAPESIIHLTMCGCNAGCKTKRCKCKKNGLKCSEMCKCQDCENVEHEDLEPIGENALLEEETLNRLNKD